MTTKSHIKTPIPERQKHSISNNKIRNQTWIHKLPLMTIPAKTKKINIHVTRGIASTTNIQLQPKSPLKLKVHFSHLQKERNF
jgi:hypothetical protein